MEIPGADLLESMHGRLPIVEAEALLKLVRKIERRGAFL
jgi:hypothetical protein